MKKLFSILFLIILYFNGIGQSVVPRSNSSITVQDSRFQAQYNLFTPRYADTTAANLQKGIDSLGAIIYTYDVQSFWGRQYSSGKKWVALGSGGGGGSGTVTNIATGLGLSGGPITTTGTLLVDTASASILSRQRAAATYQPIGSYVTGNIYTTDGTLAGNRSVALNGNTLNFNQGANPFLTLDPSSGAENATLRAYNTTGGDNSGQIVVNSSAVDAQVAIGAGFNANAKQVAITGYTDATTSNWIYYAEDNHTFTGGIKLNSLAAGASTDSVMVWNSTTKQVGYKYFPSSGSAPFLPTTGTGTATGNITGELAGNTLNIGSAGQLFLELNTTDKYSQIASNTGSENSTLTLNADIGGGNVGFNLNSNDGTNTIRIVGDAQANTITYTADTSVFNTNFKSGQNIGWNLDGHELEYLLDNPASIFAVEVAGGQYNLLIAPILNNEQAVLQAFNATGGGNAASIQNYTSDTNARTVLEAWFNDETKFAKIEALSDVSSGVLTYTADLHTIVGNVSATGNINPTTDDTYTLGDDTHRWADIFLGPASIHLGTSTSDEGLLSYNTTTNVLALTSTGAITVNKVTITAPATNSTLTVADGSSLITSGAFALTLTSTATSNATIPAGTNTLYSTLSGSITSSQLATSLTNETGSGVAVFGTSPTFTTSILLAGATSGNITLNSDALSNTLNTTTLSGAGISPAVMFAIQKSNNTLSDVNTVQSVFASSFDVWTLQASHTYYFQGMYSFTHGATSHSISMSFATGGAGSVSAIYYYVIASNTAVNTVTATQTATFVTQTSATAVNQAGANNAEQVYFSGYLTTGSGGTVTVTPQITFSAAPGGSPATLAGSYIQFSPFGTDAATNLGNVN
jgi:hypothetical protein